MGDLWVFMSRFVIMIGVGDLLGGGGFVYLGNGRGIFFF